MSSKKKIVQVKEFQTKVMRNVDKEINDFLKKNNLSKKDIVDIKYVSSLAGTLVLLVYEKEV